MLGRRPGCRAASTGERGTVVAMMMSTAGVSGHADPEGEAPWALQMVVRVDRDRPLYDVDVLETAARAVVTLLADERASGEWGPALDRWSAGRIRKIVRRARGSEWARVQDLAGVTVTGAAAEVRVFVPGPTDDVPKVLSRLQVSGTDLPATHRTVRFVPPDGWPGVVIAVNPEVSASTGKLAAQCGHAAQLAWMNMCSTIPARAQRWRDAGFPVRVVHPAAQVWPSVLERARVAVTDAGFTEVAPGTLTTVAHWP